MMTQGTGRNKLQIKEWGKGTQENVRVSRANGNTWGTFFYGYVEISCTKKTLYGNTDVKDRR